MNIDHPKFKELITYLERLGSMALAYSGGTDSTFLMAAGKIALGDHLLAFTIDTPYIARWEIEEASEICKQLGVKHKILNSEIISSIENNPENRCYLCKQHLFSSLLKEASALGFSSVVDGTNLDDKGDHRPGMRALKELKIKSPLLETGIGKELIRKFSKELGLPTWNKPAYACLLTRIPFDTKITKTELQKIESAETYLMKIGFRAIRVRSHEKLARIEVPMDRIQELIEPGIASEISRELKKIGYQYVTIDMDGYKMGSMKK